MIAMETIIQPLWLSFKIASLATVLTLTISFPLAYLFVNKRNRWTRIGSVILIMPIIIPPTVLGYYLLIMIGRESLFGQWFEALTGGPLIFTAKAAVIAATIASLPLVLRPIQQAFEGIEKDMIDAARLDGANGRQLFYYLMVPLSWNGILVGITLGFARAMGEFGATMMVAGNIPGRTQTLSIAIYDAVQANRMADAHLMVIVLSACTIGLLLLLTTIQKRKS